MDDAETAELITELEARLIRHPPDRYPVQHATDQFHLGATLTDAGRLDEAEAALDTAARLFGPDTLRTEHAKAINARGAALRLAGRLEEAATAFDHAAAVFDTTELPLEQGAALFNLGLVRRELGDTDAAATCFEQARERFESGAAPTQTAAAAREHGATLLAAGELDAARRSLEEAIDLADRARDIAGLGAASNAVGLTLLAQDRAAEAAEAFRTAVGAHPRSLRAEGFAMAQANLALAYEHAGDPARARLAASHALGAPAAAEPVRAQAAGALDRLGREAGVVLPVLDLDPSDRWPHLLREELSRWVDADAPVREAEALAWVEGQLARQGVGPDLAEAWLGGLLELPPEAMESLIRATVVALTRVEQDSAERFRSGVSRAMVRFPVPQWMRLRDTFNRIAEELGQEPSWK